MFRYTLEDIRAKYSIGEEINDIEEDFLHAIDYIKNLGERKAGYLNLLWMISLGILLETDKEHLKTLQEAVEKEKIQDFVIDYLLTACDIGYEKISNVYDKEIPYSYTREMIELAQKDKIEASKRLQKYMEKEWFQGHYDYEWRNAHKEPGYVGFWSFETAAIAKILELDDTSLKNNNHYPYDLRHYKNEMKFKQININDYIIEQNVEEEVEKIIEGIPNNPVLENIIPPKWHAFVNELIYDYTVLEDREFYDKYKEPMELDQIWFFFEDYVKSNKDKDLLGTLIVFALTDQGYILQLDWKQEIIDHYRFIKNYWKDTDTKLIDFDVGNDQMYLAYVPKDVKVNRMYEVKINDVPIDQLKES